METNKQRGQPDIMRAMESPVISDENDGGYQVSVCVCVLSGQGGALGLVR